MVWMRDSWSVMVVWRCSALLEGWREMVWWVGCEWRGLSRLAGWMEPLGRLGEDLKTGEKVEEELSGGEAWRATSKALSEGRRRL